MRFRLLAIVFTTGALLASALGIAFVVQPALSKEVEVSEAELSGAIESTEGLTEETLVCRATYGVVGDLHGITVLSNDGCGFAMPLGTWSNRANPVYPLVLGSHGTCASRPSACYDTALAIEENGGGVIGVLNESDPCVNVAARFNLEFVVAPQCVRTFSL